MTNLVALEAFNARRFDTMHIHAGRLSQLHSRAAALCAPENKVRYQGDTFTIPIIPTAAPASAPGRPEADADCVTGGATR